MAKQGKTKHPFSILLFLILLFLIPLGLAYFLYSIRNTLGEGFTNHGHLITPPFLITDMKLYPAKDQQPIRHKWILLYLYPSDCEQVCQRGLYNLQKIQRAMGKDQTRMTRAILTYRRNRANTALNTLLLTKYKGTQHLTTYKNSFERSIKARVHTHYATSPGVLYLIDPLGNVILIYKPNTAPKGIYKDLKRLLKVSQIG